MSGVVSTLVPRSRCPGAGAQLLHCVQPRAASKRDDAIRTVGARATPRGQRSSDRCSSGCGRTDQPISACERRYERRERDHRAASWRRSASATAAAADPDDAGVELERAALGRAAGLRPRPAPRAAPGRPGRSRRWTGAGRSRPPSSTGPEARIAAVATASTPIVSQTSSLTPAPARLARERPEQRRGRGGDHGHARRGERDQHQGDQAAEAGDHGRQARAAARPRPAGRGRRRGRARRARARRGRRSGRRRRPRSRCPPTQHG